MLLLWLAAQGKVETVGGCAGLCECSQGNWGLLHVPWGSLLAAANDDRGVINDGSDCRPAHGGEGGKRGLTQNIYAAQMEVDFRSQLIEFANN
eukprot:1158419-Pelagomonas_calceolata.AAC.9